MLFLNYYIDTNNIISNQDKTHKLLACGISVHNKDERGT